MNPRKLLVLSTALLASLFNLAAADRQPTAPGPVASPVFDTTGEWAYGTLPGHTASASTLYARDPNATAIWRPNLQSVCPVRISFFLVVHAGNTRNARIEVTGAAAPLAARFDLANGTSRWETVGVAKFQGRGEEQITLRNAGKGHLRSCAVRLEILDSNDTTFVWQTLILDDTVPTRQRQQPAPAITFSDVRDPAMQQAIVHSGPPPGDWELTFQDEFNAGKLDTTVWDTAHGESSPKRLYSRWPENTVVENGLLRLVTRKEKRGGKEWTSGSVGTKAFKQKYGYWEARFRYAAAPGLNNAFWTAYPRQKNVEYNGFEIDFNEGHWPNIVNMTLHQANLAPKSKSWRAPCDLSEDFHTYGVLWGEKEIVYYWDGQEIDRKPHTQAHLETPVIFSTAVIPWAGPITDALDGKSMDVDWVRVWRHNRQPRAANPAGTGGQVLTASQAGRGQP